MAERAYRTQPAVSIAIRRLEEEVGAPLLDRSQKTPTLTDAGRIVFDYARRILSLRDQAREAVGELRTLQRGRVRVDANESTSLYLLPDVILAFRERVLSDELVGELIRRADGAGYRLTVDLERREVRDDAGFAAPFEFDEFRRYCLLEGLDDIGLTLRHEAEIAAYEGRRAEGRPGGTSIPSQR